MFIATPQAKKAKLHRSDMAVLRVAPDGAAIFFSTRRASRNYGSAWSVECEGRQ